ncbi:MAG: glycosyltransferase family 4 protein [Candidatus Acetothermia bacterium]|jgi:1,2-diacylglycerol-3-alpha-glucose alpha-1,2-glucosyltransferase|nr:glycosyltransferase family 4 protein [Candidatus Acetothermia bacterium]MDH7504773.1 glycosyltransferase family 4 protein [Candidatus Acetothermia bacterium]
MRVCLYLEFSRLPLVAKSGFHTAFLNQKRALELAGVEVVTDPHSDYQLLHLQGYGPRSFYYLKRAKRQGKSVVVHAHSIGSYDLRGSFTLTNWIAPLYERLLHYFYSQGDAIFTPSERAKELLQGSGLANRIEVVSNGIDGERLTFSAEKRERFRERLGLARFTVVSVGNIIPRKGVLDFIALARALPQYDFVWYGQHWNRLLAFHPKLERTLRSKPPNLRLPGFVHDIQGALSAGDLFFFPSYGENQPVALLEAAAIGLPLVVRDLPEYRGWLEEGENCLKGRTNEEFARLIRRVAEDEPLRARLAQVARRLAEQHSLEIVGKRLVELYTNLLERR